MSSSSNQSNMRSDTSNQSSDSRPDSVTSNFRQRLNGLLSLASRVSQEVQDEVATILAAAEGVLLRSRERSSAPSPSPHLVDTTWNIQSEDDSSSDSSSAESVHDLPLPGTLAGPQSGNDGGPFSASSAESPEALSEAIRAETERSSAFARVVEIAGILANHEDSTGDRDVHLTDSPSDSTSSTMAQHGSPDLAIYPAQSSPQPHPLSRQHSVLDLSNPDIEALSSRPPRQLTRDGPSRSGLERERADTALMPPPDEVPARRPNTGRDDNTSESTESSPRRRTAPLERHQSFYDRSRPHVFWDEARWGPKPSSPTGPAPSTSRHHARSARPRSSTGTRAPLTRQGAFYDRSHPHIYWDPSWGPRPRQPSSPRDPPNSISDLIPEDMTAREFSDLFMGPRSTLLAAFDRLRAQREERARREQPVLRIVETSRWRRDPDWEGGIRRPSEERERPPARADDSADSQAGDIDYLSELADEQDVKEEEAEVSIPSPRMTGRAAMQPASSPLPTRGTKRERDDESEISPSPVSDERPSSRRRLNRSSVLHEGGSINTVSGERSAAAAPPTSPLHPAPVAAAPPSTVTAPEEPAVPDTPSHLDRTPDSVMEALTNRGASPASDTHSSYTLSQTVDRSTPGPEDVSTQESTTGPSTPGSSQEPVTGLPGHRSVSSSPRRKRSRESDGDEEDKHIALGVERHSSPAKRRRA
ncbi:hypothetical protein AcW1_003288 [Taiwanofungus camphoratus]|nr:hypothetical protein AcW1_003288 [Antrodia cinnamomea]